MVRTNPQQRKDIVLSMVVRQYIRTIEPVSSAFIAEEYDRDISSATIRNILAELEADGFLTHPHTSAGRMPTQRGYRYFVDFLMQEIELLDEERRRVQHEYEAGVQELEGLIEKTTELVSDLTHCASIVTIDGYPRAFAFRGTSYLAQAVGTESLQKVVEVLKAIEEKERVLELIRRDLGRRIKIYIGHETACQAFENCALAVSRFEMRRGPTGRIAVLGPSRMDYQRVVSALEYVSEVLHEMV
jgi:transcriptional regulator of heat shock response